MGIVLTHSAKYKPMSFERLIQPYVMATEEYRTLEKGIADLDAEAESMRQIAQKEIDAAKTEGRTPKSFATEYMNYADSLDAKAAELANKGLKGINRKSLYDLQAQYKTKVKPIEDADKYIKEIAKEQRLLNKSGNIVFDRDFSNGVSIQDVIDNPSLGYNVYDLDDYGKQAVLEGTAIKAGMTPTYLGKDSTDQNIFYSQGMSDEEINNWLAGTSNEELDATVNRIAGNAPQAVKDRVKSDLAKSLRATVSKEANRGYETTAQINSRIKSDNALAAKMIEDGYMEGKGNKWIPDPDSPAWIIKGVKPEYVKDENGNIQKDAYGNPIITFSKDSKPGTAKPSNNEAEKTKELERQMREHNNIEDRKRLAAKEGFATDKKGNLIPIDPNNPSKGYMKIEDVTTVTDSSGIPLEPIFIDKAGWIPGWSAPGYEGEDRSGIFNWWDINRQTRDWGADYSLEDFEETPNNFELIEKEDITKEEYRKAIEEMKKKVGTSFKVSNYDFYKTKKGPEGIIAIPKGYLKNNNIKESLAVDPQLS